MITFVIIALVLYTLLAWRNRRLAIAVLLFGLPTYLIRFPIAGIPMTFLEGMILILFIIWLLSGRWRRYHLSPITYNLVAPIALFIFSGTMAALISPDIRAALGLWKAYIIEPILFFIVFIDTFTKTDVTINFPIGKNIVNAHTSSKEPFRLVFFVLASSALIISALAIYQKFTGWMIPHPWQEEAVRRVTSVYGFPNAVGLFLAPIVVFLITWTIVSLSSQERVRVRVRVRFVMCYMLCVSLMSIAAIIFAKSEGAIAGILAGLFFFGIMQKKFRRWTILATSALILLIVLINPWRSYVTQQLTFTNDSGIVRRSQWKETITMLKDRPLSGAGLAGYKLALIPYHKAKHIEIYQYPHNILLNFWSEMGLLGLIAFLWLVVIFYQNGIRLFKNLEIRNCPDSVEDSRSHRRKLEIPAMASMTTLLIHGLVDVPYFKNDLAILFWLLFGMMIVISPLKVRGD